MSTISIIGSGTMATAIAGRVAKTGHTVELIGRDTGKAQALADKLASGAITEPMAPRRRAVSSSWPCPTLAQRPTSVMRSTAR
jgi:3-hydroxyisobutyrate dehydrogenase-like beta-hydroxyacid dehydrogenase